MTEISLHRPKVSALSWAVFDGRTAELLFGVNEDNLLCVRGLTKIMTAFTVLQIVRKIKIDMKNTIFVVNSNKNS